MIMNQESLFVDYNKIIMQETLNFLTIIDNKLKKSQTNTPTHAQSLKQKMYLKRNNNRFPFAKAIDFSENKYNDFPSWLTQKQGFIDFMYKNYQNKLMSIPKICQKANRASDQRYFISLYLQKIPIFTSLPNVINQIILSNITTRYYKPGDVLHYENNNPSFMGVIFVGSVQFKSGKRLVTKQQNQVILQQAFYGRKHETIVCRQQSIILALDVKVYQLIINKLKQQIQTKQRDEISDMLKSTFYSELHLKDRRARNFYQQFQLEFYFRGQVIADAGTEVDKFFMIYKGEVIEENHIYIREHNKWPLPSRKWEVRAVYNSYHKSNKLQRFAFFGDEQIVSSSKFKSRYISDNWVIMLAMPVNSFIATLTSQDVKRLKKYRSEHVDLNYVDFEKNIRDKVKSFSEHKKIIKKAINTTLAHKDHFSPRKMSLINSFEKKMLEKSFFDDKPAKRSFLDD